MPGHRLDPVAAARERRRQAPRLRKSVIDHGWLAYPDKISCGIIGANKMLPGRHPTAQRFSRALLHLVSFGLAGAVMISLFGLASFSLLNNSKESIAGSRTGQGAAGPGLFGESGGPPPAAVETKPSNTGAASLLPVSPAHDPSTAEAPVAKSEAKPVPDPLPPDRDGAAAGSVNPPAAAPVDRSADEAHPPEITLAQPPAAQPMSATDEPSPPPAKSQAAIPQTKTSVSDQERDEMFHRFEIEQQRLTSGEPADPTSTRKPVAKSARKGRFDNLLSAHNTGWRDGVRKECGPIKDPASYRRCVAVFSGHHR